MPRFALAILAAAMLFLGSHGITSAQTQVFVVTRAVATAPEPIYCPGIRFRFAYIMAQGYLPVAMANYFLQAAGCNPF